MSHRDGTGVAGAIMPPTMAQVVSLSPSPRTVVQRAVSKSGE